MTWMFLFDVGISKGMRNHLTASLVDGNILKARKLISTAYMTTGMISLFFFLAIIFFTRNIDIAKFLNISNYSSKQIYNVYLLFVSIMFINLFLGTINQILYAKHKSSVNAINALAINIIYIVCLLFCIFFNIDNIVFISIGYGFSLVFCYLTTTILFFTKNKNLIPNIAFYSKDVIKVILNDGLKILLVQLLFFTFLGLDRFIILKFSSATDVTNYDIMYKVMSLLLFPWSIIAQPLWSSYSEAYKRHDFKWIKTVYKRLLYFFMVVIIGVFLLAFSFDFITAIWIDKVLDVEFNLLLLTGCLILVIMWSTMHSDILFGLNKFKIPLIAAIIGVGVKIIIIFWSISTNFSVSNLIISSIAAYAIFCFLGPIKVFNTLKK
jgi:O-antigen/teichoic acid export membrane protein